MKKQCRQKCLRCQNVKFYAVGPVNFWVKKDRVKTITFIVIYARPRATAATLRCSPGNNETTFIIAQWTTMPQLFSVD